LDALVNDADDALVQVLSEVTDAAGVQTLRALALLRLVFALATTSYKLQQLEHDIGRKFRVKRLTGSNLVVQQDLFYNVQAGESPRLNERRQVLVQQELIEECFVLLVGQVRLDNRVEESAVFLVNEEMQLVARVLVVLFFLFFVLKLKPLQYKVELFQRRLGSSVTGKKSLISNPNPYRITSAE
jgi:hypothetical protein